MVGAGLALLGALASNPAAGIIVPCGNQPERERIRIERALQTIRSSIDPCGGSSEVSELLREVETCPTGRYEICIDRTATRNVFDRPSGAHRRSQTRTITWNPDLRAEIEQGCGGDPGFPVVRDPIASLLHELAHAAQDCRGLDPREHEFDAVRIENIYRRATRSCQRTRYGADFLPTSMLLSCEPGGCVCRPPTDSASAGTTLTPQHGADAQAADSLSGRSRERGQPATP